MKLVQITTVTEAAIHQRAESHMTEREWCEQIWPVLVERARSGQTINYQSLKVLVVFNGWQ
jgi:hypothetical protein